MITKNLTEDILANFSSIDVLINCIIGKLWQTDETLKSLKEPFLENFINDAIQLSFLLQKEAKEGHKTVDTLLTQIENS